VPTLEPFKSILNRDIISNLIHRIRTNLISAQKFVYNNNKYFVKNSILLPTYIHRPGTPRHG